MRTSGYRVPSRAGVITSGARASGSLGCPPASYRRRHHRGRRRSRLAQPRLAEAGRIGDQRIGACLRCASVEPIFHVPEHQPRQRSARQQQARPHYRPACATRSNLRAFRSNIALDAPGVANHMTPRRTRRSRSPTLQSSRRRISAAAPRLEDSNPWGSGVRLGASSRKFA